MWSYIFTFIAGLIVGLGIIVIWKAMQSLTEIRLASTATEEARHALHGRAMDEDAQRTVPDLPHTPNRSYAWQSS